uniref:Uncharacterized protein n=1 Tax=Avena sativa TaxID=4498 RepID=A0ACD5T9A2_AVESA
MIPIGRRTILLEQHSAAPLLPASPDQNISYSEEYGLHLFLLSRLVAGRLAAEHRFLFPPNREKSKVFSSSKHTSRDNMPKIKTSRVKYPEGWELIEPTLRDLEAKMREAENDTHDGKRKCEALWPIFRISHQKSRYIYDLYYRRKEISKDLYEFCLDQGYADKNLIAKWKKPGYERLCCLRCIQTRDHNFATTCVCRVPKHLREEKVIECVHCGCKGCASGD